MSIHSNGPRSAAVAAAIAIALGAAHAQAQQSATKSVENTLTFNIPAQSLASALNQFGDVTGYQLVYEASLAENKRSAEVAGTLKARDALARMLSGTGLEYRFTDDRTVVIRAVRSGSDTRVLGPVRVEGNERRAPARGEGIAQLGGVRGGQDQEERGLRPVVAAVGTGAPTAIEDIPRSISVLTQTQIEAQDVQDFGEAIRRLPGLSLTERTGDTGSSAARVNGDINSRGFLLNKVQIDGGAPRLLDIINNGLFNLDAYERVELVHGPNGVFAGTGSPGGSLNLVRKRPGAEPMLDVTAVAGSFGRKGGKVDWSTPELFGSVLAFRGGVSYEDQEFKWANDRRKRGSAFGIVDMPLGEQARLEVGAQYQNIREDGFYQGTERYYDGPTLDVPFYFNYAPPWGYLDADTFELFTRYYVRLLDDWNFDFGLTYSRADERSLDSSINGTLYLLSNTNATYQTCTNGVCRPNESTFFARQNDFETDELGIDFRITGQFETWGLDHSIYVAGDFNETITADSQLARNNPAWRPIYTLDDYLAVPNLAPRSEDPGFAASDMGFKDSTSAYGLTISDTVSWRDRVYLTLNTRYQDQELSSGTLARRRWEGAPYLINLTETGLGNINRAQEWRPSWALAVKPLRPLTIYGSYSEGSNDQSTRFTQERKQLDPTTFENAELGVKYGGWGWLLTASAFKLQQDNVATEMPGTRGLCPPTPTSICYYAAGASIESKGLHFEMSGRLLDQLDLQLSYTTNETLQLSTHLPQNSRAPQKLAKLFLNWDVPMLARLSINAGATYTGRIYERGTRTIYDPDTFAIIDRLPYDFEEASTLIWDVGANYGITDHLSAQLLVENVADTEYYSTVKSHVNHVGNPRTAMLKVIWREGFDRSGLTASPTTGLAPFGDPADWYGSLDVGSQISDDWDARSTGKGTNGEALRWTFETEPSAAFGARLGYRLTPQWRSELNLGWRQHGFGKIGGSDTVPFGLCSVDYFASFVGTNQDRLTNCFEPQGEAVYWSFGGNLIRDFRSPEVRLRPFLGVGLGATRASVDFSGRFDGYVDTAYRNWYQRTFGTPPPPTELLAPGERVYGADASWGLSFQAIAGLSWRITDQAILDATYKYTRDALDVRTANLTDYYPRESLPGSPSRPEPNPLIGSGVPQIGSFKGDLNSHVLTLGLRWSFGVRK